MLEAEKWRLGAGGDELEKGAPLLVAEVLLQDLPEPSNDPVAVVEAAVVVGVLPENTIFFEELNFPGGKNKKSANSINQYVTSNL